MGNQLWFYNIHKYGSAIFTRKENATNGLYNRFWILGLDYPYLIVSDVELFWYNLFPTSKTILPLYGFFRWWCLGHSSEGFIQISFVYAWSGAFWFKIGWWESFAYFDHSTLNGLVLVALWMKNIHYSSICLTGATA